MTVMSTSKFIGTSYILYQFYNNILIIEFKTILHVYENIQYYFNYSI